MSAAAARIGAARLPAPVLRMRKQTGAIARHRSQAAHALRRFETSYWFACESR